MDHRCELEQKIEQNLIFFSKDLGTSSILFDRRINMIIRVAATSNDLSYFF